MPVNRRVKTEAHKRTAASGLLNGSIGEPVDILRVPELKSCMRLACTRATLGGVTTKSPYDVNTSTYSQLVMDIVSHDKLTVTKKMTNNGLFYVMVTYTGLPDGSEVTGGAISRCVGTAIGLAAARAVARIVDWKASRKSPTATTGVKNTTSCC